jgi:predicted kinase
MKNALDLLGKEKNYKEIFPQFYNHTQDMGPKYDLVRAQNKLWTSSQVLMNLNKKELILYLIPGAVKFIGIENKLPENYKSKIKLNVRQYEHSPHDKYDTFVTTDEKPKKSAIKDTDVVSEGVDDPGILKAVFLAGGPGSGKTWVARGLFGIPDKVNVSQTGLKMVNTDKELKYLLNKYGFGTDLDILPDEVFKNLTDPTSKNYSGLRTFAKELTGVRKNQYMNGRLGMIIDGTGDDFKEIRKQKREVEKLGYDTYMIFINTSLDIALQRNEKRDRVLPISVVKNSHREVVKNIGGYQGLFGGSNFLVIDNNKDLDEKSAQKRFNMLVKRGLSKFVNKPIRNKIGKGWVSKNKILKKMTKESFKELVSERKESYRKIAKELIKKYRVYSKLGFKTGATKGSYDFDNNKIWLRPYYSYKKDFLLTILHEIYHAMDSKRFGRKEFVRRYQKAGDVLVNNGYDFHNDNPFEIAAEKWARREINKYK